MDYISLPIQRDRFDLFQLGWTEALLSGWCFLSLELWWFVGRSSANDATSRDRRSAVVDSAVVLSLLGDLCINYSFPIKPNRKNELILISSMIISVSAQTKAQTTSYPCPSTLNWIVGFADESILGKISLWCDWKSTDSHFSQGNYRMHWPVPIFPSFLDHGRLVFYKRYS